MSERPREPRVTPILAPGGGASDSRPRSRPQGVRSLTAEGERAFFRTLGIWIMLSISLGVALLLVVRGSDHDASDDDVPISVDDDDSPGAVAPPQSAPVAAPTPAPAAPPAAVPLPSPVPAIPIAPAALPAPLPRTSPLPGARPGGPAGQRALAAPLPRPAPARVAPAPLRPTPDAVAAAARARRPGGKLTPASGAVATDAQPAETAGHPGRDEGTSPAAAPAPARVEAPAAPTRDAGSAAAAPTK
jgi:type IV secretory pathway VirB10-like protein